MWRHHSLSWLLGITLCVASSLAQEAYNGRLHSSVGLPDSDPLLQVDVSVSEARVRNQSQGLQDLLLESASSSKELRLIEVAATLRTKMNAAVFVVVFLLIFVPVAVAVVLGGFMWLESKDWPSKHQVEEEPKAVSPLPSQGLDPGYSPLGEPPDQGPGRSRLPADQGRQSTPLDRQGYRRLTHGSGSRSRSMSMMSSQTPSQEYGAPRQMDQRSDLDTDTASISSGGSGNALCTQLVVQTQQGVTLLINGQIEPYQQEEVIDVSNTSSISSEVILRVFMSEAGKDSGVLLESPQRFPIAFLHTGEAGIKPKDQPDTGATEGMHIPVSRASCFTARTGFSQDSYFGAVRIQKGNQVVMTRGSDPGGAPLLVVSVRVGTPHMSVSDSNGRIIASVEPRRQQIQRPQQVLHVEYDVDVAMVLCAVIAAVKLRPR